MSAGAGPSIKPDDIAALEAIIDDQGILDTPEERAIKQRTDDDADNAPVVEEEKPATEAPTGDESEQDPTQAAEGDDDGQEGDQSADDGELISTVEQLASALEAEPDDILDSIEFDNGLGATVPLRQVVDSWRNTTVTLAETQERIEADHQSHLAEMNTKVDKQLTELAGLSKALIEEMQAEFAAADFETLKQTDPERAIELIQKQQRVRDLIGRAAAQLQSTSQDRAEQSSDDLMRVKKREAQRLAQKMPHWVGNQDLLKEVIAENVDVAKSVGFSDEDIEGITDHRQLIILHWAAQYRKSLKAARSKTLDQLDKDRPGLRRPGLGVRASTREDAPAPEVADRQRRQVRFRKSKTVKDAGALLETFIK